MRHPLIRAGEGPQAAHQRITRERQAHRAALDQAHRELTTTTIAGATAAGDQRKLRGIPILARGVPGHIPGTRP